MRIYLQFTMTVLVVATTARAQEVSPGTVKLPSPGEQGAVALFTLQNSGMYVAYLMSATSDVAGKVEFHEAAKGPQAQTYIAIEPGDVKRMDPKGTFVYLTDLKRPLKDGETITVTFKNEGEIPIEVAAVVTAN
jgi:periplasmic copper chaperone A